MAIDKIIKKVKSGMVGRIADDKNNVNYLLETVKEAGDGNYLEIGVLHGGSLCAVALLKKELKHAGRCYGVDPLDGYYTDYMDVRKRGKLIDPVTKLPVDLETVNENIKRFRLDNVSLIVERSKGLRFNDLKFAVSYIDGDHWGDAPLEDWHTVKDATQKFVIFDNSDNPDVRRACDAAKSDQDWCEVLDVGITYIVRRQYD